MRAINPMQYAEDAEQHLKRLCEIDYYRKEYYKDLGKTRSISNPEPCRIRN